MNYFTALGLIFGSLALLKPVYLHILPFNESKLLAQAYAEKRPAWILPVVLLGLSLVGYTWYQELNTDIRYSIVLTLLFSLTAIKGVILLFDYQKFQKWLHEMLNKNKGKKIVLIDIGASIFGLIMIILTLVIL